MPRSHPGWAEGAHDKSQNGDEGGELGCGELTDGHGVGGEPDVGLEAGEQSFGETRPERSQGIGREGQIRPEGAGPPDCRTQRIPPSPRKIPPSAEAPGHNVRIRLSELMGEGAP